MRLLPVREGRMTATSYRRARAAALRHIRKLELARLRAGLSNPYVVRFYYCGVEIRMCGWCGHGLTERRCPCTPMHTRRRAA